MIHLFMHTYSFLSYSSNVVASAECPELCTPSCTSNNSFCHCASKTCVCKPGFTGADCSVDICSLARCGEHGTCSSRYLGDSPLPVSTQACICEKGYHGPLCDKQEPINLARQPGVSASQSSTCWDGPPSRAIDGDTNQFWGGNTITHTCEEDSPWWMVDLLKEQVIQQVLLYNRWDDCCRDRFSDSEVQILDANMTVIVSEPIINGISVNYIYFNDIVGRYVQVKKNSAGDLNIAEVKVFNQVQKCGNPTCTFADDDCKIAPGCNPNGSCPAQSTFELDGKPCNSKPMGTCLAGQCIQPLTSSPTLEPTLSPVTFPPTQYKMTERVNLVTSGVAQASQSSTCHGGPPGRAIDGK